MLRYGSAPRLAHAADPHLPDAARSADHHQVERTLAGASPRAHGLCRGEDLRRRTANSPANAASSASFTSSAYSRRPSDIPLLRLKVENVKQQRGLSRPNSHDGKALAHILDTFPRDELFQISDDELFHRRRSAYPAARRAPEGARVRALRPLRPLRNGPRLCPARPLRHGGARKGPCDPRLAPSTGA